jgi:hypothetical protein
VVVIAAAALADLIADPIPVKSCEAATKLCGERDTKDDTCGSYQDTPHTIKLDLSRSRLISSRYGAKGSPARRL